MTRAASPKFSSPPIQRIRTIQRERRASQRPLRLRRRQRRLASMPVLFLFMGDTYRRRVGNSGLVSNDRCNAHFIAAIGICALYLQRRGSLTHHEMVSRLGPGQTQIHCAARSVTARGPLLPTRLDRLPERI